MREPASQRVDACLNHVLRSIEVRLADLEVHHIASLGFQRARAHQYLKRSFRSQPLHPFRQAQRKRFILKFGVIKANCRSGHSRSLPQAKCLGTAQAQSRPCTAPTATRTLVPLACAGNIQPAEFRRTHLTFLTKSPSQPTRLNSLKAV